jgi:hypothetical protein
MARRAWWIRDLITAAIYVALLIGATYLLEYAAGYYPAMRYYHRILVMPGSSRSAMPDSWPSARTSRRF